MIFYKGKLKLTLGKIDGIYDMKTDLLITWPRHIDYPLFRLTLAKYRWYFEKIYIALVQSNLPRDLSVFLIETLPWAQFVKPPAVRSDWRDNAIYDLLIHSQAEMILFLEQDFLIKDGVLLDFAVNCHQPFLGFREGERIHPGFVLIKREIIEKTSKDFSANPPAHDHFGQFFQEVAKLVKMKFIEEYGFDKKVHYYHLNGLTQNFQCYQERQPFYRPEEFLTYNSCCLRLDIRQEPEFLLLQKEIELRHGGSDVEFIKKFFPSEARHGRHL